MSQSESRAADRNKPTVEWRGFDPQKIAFPSWLVDGLLPEGSTCCLYGAPNTGKSFLVLDMALAIATGRPWLDIPTRIQVGKSKERGKVVYILAESPESLNRRIAAWLQHHKIPREEGVNELDGHFYIPLVENLQLDRPESLKALIHEIRANCPDVALIVFDPLASYMVGDENSARDTQTLINALRKLVDAFKESNCSGLMIHHSGKNAAKSERGSSALRGGVDTLLELAKDRIQIQKQRDAGKGPDIQIELVTVVEVAEDGTERDLGKVVVKPTALLPTNSKSSKIDQLLFDGLGEGSIHATSRPHVRKVPVRTQKARNNLEIVIDAVTRLTAGVPDKSVSAAKILTDVAGRFSGKQATFYTFIKTHASEDGSTPLRKLANGRYTLSQPSAAPAIQAASTEGQEP